MSVYNSSTGDDDSATMIDPSFMHNNSAESDSDSVVKHMKQVNRSRANNPASDYVYVDHRSSEHAQEIEQILIFYRQDLKHESKSQYDCNGRLIARLVDIIRPIYASNEKQMKDLDILYEEICELQDVRHIEQKEKLEHLTNEIAHLKKLILGTTNDHTDMNSNTMTKALQINSMVNYEQWQQLEDETKQLQNVIEAQRTKIDELLTFLSNEGTRSTPASKPSTSGVSKSENTPDKQRAITVQNLRTLTRLPPASQDQTCPICNHKFSFLSTDADIEKHIDECLTELDRNTSKLTQYQCPQCHRDFPVNDKIYLQHLTDCLNQI